MTVGDGSPVYHKERLSEAIRWLDQQDSGEHSVVEEACRRFDLSPADEEFLRDMWRRRSNSPAG